MTKEVIHPIFGTFTYQSGDIYKDIFKQIRLLPYQYRILVQYHENRVERVKADNYATKGLRTKDNNEYEDELLIIDFWRQMAELRLDKQGRIM
jgi:hypothetical protein